MEKKLTAVEWLANELYEKFEMRGDGILYDEILNQAKEMEKQQIMEAVYDSMGTNFDPNMGRAEQYYNTKFKTN
jgi:hypothetical protein